MGGVGTGLWLRGSRLGGAVGSVDLAQELVFRAGLIEEVWDVIWEKQRSREWQMRGGRNWCFGIEMYSA